MCQQVSLKILYHERRNFGLSPEDTVDTLLFCVDDTPAGSLYMLKSTVWVSFKLSTNLVEILPSQTDSQAIRTAIEQFERLVQAHPCSQAAHTPAPAPELLMTVEPTYEPFDEDPEPADIELPRCLICDKSFTPARVDSKYCSKACGTKAYNRKSVEKRSNAPAATRSLAAGEYLVDGQALERAEFTEKLKAETWPVGMRVRAGNGTEYEIVRTQGNRLSIKPAHMVAK